MVAFAAEHLSAVEGASFDMAIDVAPVAPSSVFTPAIHIELIGARAMIAVQSAWSDLARRAMEPNVFLDPAFALPLLQHVRFDTRPDFLLAWEEDGPTSFGRLIGLLPLHLPRTRGRLARGFHHPQVTLGVPLLDEARGMEAFPAMTAWIGQHYPRLAGLVLAAVPTQGAFYRGLVETASPAELALLDQRQRAVLRHATAGKAEALSPKRRKELRRQRRRLEEGGTLAYCSARTPSEIRRAAERFLTLEASGWKGRRGSALLHDPSLATFTRTMTRLMAHEGSCRIDSLERDGQPLAMGILVMAGTQAYFWKTTFDERFAPFSPGVQFALDLTQAQLAEPAFALTDSCAVPDHPMIDRIWSDRAAVADVLIRLPGRRPKAFGRAVRLETMRRRCRGWAKTIVKAALRWRGRTH